MVDLTGCRGSIRADCGGGTAELGGKDGVDGVERGDRDWTATAVYAGKFGDKAAIGGEGYEDLWDAGHGLLSLVK
jgi:hypothetical protein